MTRPKYLMWPLFGPLVDSTLRRLLDAQLAEQIDNPHESEVIGNDEVVKAMMALLARDGLSQ